LPPPGRTRGTDQQHPVERSAVSLPCRTPVPLELRASKAASMKALWTISLLVLSNAFMTLAWYGHLRFKDFSWGKGLGLFAIILISWGIAFFEYVLQVPANRIGHNAHGGPFTLVQLKVLQEVITLVVFTVFTLVAFRQEALRWNHLLAAAFLVAAVWLVFKR